MLDFNKDKLDKLESKLSEDFESELNQIQSYMKRLFKYLLFKKRGKKCLLPV